MVETQPHSAWAPSGTSRRMGRTEVSTDRRTNAHEVDIIAIGPADEGRLPSGEPVGQGALSAAEVDPVAGDQPADRIGPGRPDPILDAVQLGDVLRGDLAGDAVDVREAVALQVGNHREGEGRVGHEIGDRWPGFAR